MLDEFEVAATALVGRIAPGFVAADRIEFPVEVAELAPLARDILAFVVEAR